MGIKHFCTPLPSLEGVPDATFHHAINAAVAHSYDHGRYYYFSRDVVKNCVRHRDNHKVVREAMDLCREEIMKACPGNISDFMRNWIMATISYLAQNGGNPKLYMKEEDGVTLFLKTATEGKGIPFLLGQIFGVPADLEKTIEDAFREKFAPFPAVHFPKGTGKNRREEEPPPVDQSQQALRDMEHWFGPIGQSMSLLGVSTSLVPGAPGLMNPPSDFRSAPY